MNRLIEPPPSFERLVLGCIDADFAKSTNWTALDEIYKIYILLHCLTFKISATIRYTLILTSHTADGMFFYPSTFVCWGGFSTK